MGYTGQIYTLYESQEETTERGRKLIWRNNGWKRINCGEGNGHSASRSPTDQTRMSPKKTTLKHVKIKHQKSKT